MNDLLSSLNTAHRIDATLEQIIETTIGRLEDGHPIDVEMLVAAHPKYVEQLRELLPMVAVMVRLGEATTGTPGEGWNEGESKNGSALSPRHDKSRTIFALPVGEDVEAVPQQHQKLGDFRILRELGRGGMGVVYEAEQLSIGRTVALKVLPFAAMLDRQQLNRFKNEARAAGTLDHPNIVAIHSVGCERGVHYYAMQLIEGRSLAEVIAHLKPGRPPSDEETAPAAVANRSPTADNTVKAALSTVQTRGSAAFSTIPSVKSREFYRNAARLGIQAGEALDHAHQNGILHRDIKPANLLVENTGKLWIADFGLARVEADAGLTMTGELLGTLRYMSPEQALGQRIIIDHRTDIYSLGATLYELLTLQPAFAETDRAKLLQQIAVEEPRPLRKIDARIPAELDTIVLKAMAKPREERYQTAAQFADDLRAFLENRPIKARPPGLANRAAKWSRRHQALISGAAIGFVLLSVVLAVSMVRVQHANIKATAALQETADLLYTTDMTLAYQTHERGWSDEVQTILDRYRPSEGEPDRRGFEWHLLQALVEQPSSVTLAAHEGPVNELAEFPDRRRLASVGNDGTLRIWDVRTRKLERTIKICNAELHSVAISRGGRYVAVGSFGDADRKRSAVYLCNLKQDAQISEPFHGEYTVESLAFSGNGEQLAIGTRYDEVCLITLDGRVINRISCKTRNRSLEFVPSRGLWLLSNRRITAEHKTLDIAQLWREDLFGMERELDGERENSNREIDIARLSPCGRFVAAGHERLSRMHMFEMETGARITGTPASRDWLNDLAYSPDGNAIACGYRNGQVEIFSIQPDPDGNPMFEERPRVFSAHQGEVRSVRFMDAATLATCGTDGLVRIWGLNHDATNAFDVADIGMNSMALSPNGRLLLCVGKSEFRIIDTQSGDVVFRRGNSDAGYKGAAWSPAGDKAAVAAPTAESVIVFNPAGEEVCEIPRVGTINELAFSPSGSGIAIIGEESWQIASSDNGQAIFRRSLQAFGNAIAYSHDGARIAYGGDSRRICLFDADKLQPLYEIPCDSNLRCLAFSPNDSLLASGHADSTVRTWDVQTGRMLGEFAGHERNVSHVAFSPDGRTLLSLAADGARLWSLDHNRGFGVYHRRPSTRGAPGATYAMTLSADGRSLAVGYETANQEAPDVMLWRIDPSASN